MRNVAVLDFAEKLGDKHVFSIKQDVIHELSTSNATAYRYLNELKSLGIAKFNTKKSGHFILNKSVISQRHIFQELLPSLEALKNARRFGREYGRNESDINFAMNNIPHRLVTLDYKAWELTKFQYPSNLYLYVDDVDKTATYLKERRFREGKNGQVVILPSIGDFTNEIQRVYLDCIANGGRSINDAIAIHILYGDHLKYKANFPLESILKVKGELPAYGVAPTTT
jgi:hypothetical protein